MKINPIQLNKFQTFGAKNKKIRDADDIMRISINEFPRLSSTYIDTFYLSTKNEQKSPLHHLAKHISNKLCSKINAQREIIKKRTDVNSAVMSYALTAAGVEKNKAANCEEAAICALAALTANGMYNSRRMFLYLQTDYIDKKTGECVYSGQSPLDHSFVITTMSDLKLGEAKEKDIIVVDPWLGFTDSLSNAKARFKQIYDASDMNSINQYHKSLFKLKIMEQTHQEPNYNDYDIKQKLILVNADKYDENDMKQLGNFMKVYYNGLVKKPQNIPASSGQHSQGIF